MKKSTRNFLIALVIVISIAALGYMGKMMIDGEGFNIFNAKVIDEDKENNKEDIEKDKVKDKKEEISVKEFTKILKKEGFKVSDEKDLIKGASVESMTFAKPKDESYQFEFIVYPNKEIAERTFSNRRGKIAEDYKIDLEGDLDKVHNGNSTEYNIYKEEINNRFYYVSRIGNSMLNINAPIEYKGEVLDIVEKINY